MTIPVDRLELPECPFSDTAGFARAFAASSLRNADTAVLKDVVASGECVMSPSVGMTGLELWVAEELDRVRRLAGRAGARRGRARARSDMARVVEAAAEDGDGADDGVEMEVEVEVEIETRSTRARAGS